MVIGELWRKETTPMVPLDSMRLFTGTSNPELAKNIASELNMQLGDMTVTTFADGEIRIQVNESVRGSDVFVIQSLCCPINDAVMELLITIDALFRASARRITAVVPYYGYARQDKKVKPREPLTAKLLANLITRAGADRMLTIDLHAGQIQGFFDIPVDHLIAGPIIAEYLKKNICVHHESVVVSPDVGGVPRATALAEILGLPIAIIVKRRPEPNKTEVMQVIGDVKDKCCIMIDDMIDTGGSIASGAQALADRGAREIYASCTHPVFSDGAVEKLQKAPIKEVIVTDTIPLSPEKRFDKVRILSVAGLLADGICRIHSEESVSELFTTCGPQKQ
jgi:ribose-phosphate pyrophosphokinase